MIDAVYNAKILDFAGNIPHVGVLVDADASAKAHSKLCGSTVKVDLQMDGDAIVGFAQDVKACALGQASSSIVGQNIIGATAAEMRKAKAQMYAMLKEDGPAPDGRFSELKFLEPVREYRARHASTLMIFDAVVDAIEQIEAQHAKAVEAAE